MATKRIYGSLPGVFIHCKALVETEEIGEGSRVWAFAHVMNGARVGTDCNICDGAFIEGGAVVGNRVTVKNHVLLWDKVTIEDDVFLGPNAVFTNDMRPRAFVKKGPEQFDPTRVKQGATIGANATVVCGVDVGRYAFVAAGTVVTKDVPDHAFVAGNPGVQKGWACKCGERLPELQDGRATCPACGEAYARAETGLVPAPRAEAA